MTTGANCETELRLGLPGDEIPKPNCNGKRGFSETETETVDLKLHLSSAPTTEKAAKPPAKAQVVGWPPVRSFRKNTMAAQKPTTESETGKADASGGGAVALVKVSMDGAPYLRKVDLKMYKSYQELTLALVAMFRSFASSEKKELIDPVTGSEFVLTYEDKDGDWMLVGDVPWGMFAESCKRMRIMTNGSSDAKC